MSRLPVLLPLLASAALAPAADAPPISAPWPGFLGGGVAIDEATPPLTWSATENVAWTADLPGVGQSNPVVAGGLAFLTQVLGENKESIAVVAVDLADGTERWRYEAPSARTEKVSLYVSLAAPSPVVIDETLYAFFETGDLVALGFDGKARWKKDLIAEVEPFSIRHGLAGSLLAVDGKLIALFDQEGPSALIALDPADGLILWKTDRETTTAWSSPVAMTVAGEPQIVTSSAGEIAGYDPVDGRELWRIDGVGGNNVPSPMPFADGKFLIGANGGRGGESAVVAAETNGAYEVVPAGDGFEARLLWNTDEATTSFNSPAAHRGHGYWVSRVGAIWCLDLATGERAYRKRVDGGSCWATPLGVGDRLYVPGRRGETTVLAAGPEYEVLANNVLFESAEDAGPFGGPTVYAIAVVGDTLLLRTGDKLFAIRDGEGLTRN